MNDVAHHVVESPATADVSYANSSRHVVVWWCIWLLVSWTVALMWHGTVHAAPLMALAIALGFFLIWPLLRLSEATQVAEGQYAFLPLLTILTDWVSLMIVSQAVFWPLQIVHRWPIDQAIWLNAGIGCWALATGLFIAWGRGCRGGWGRSFAMLLCLGVAASGAIFTLVVAALGKPGPVDHSILAFGPVVSVWRLSQTPTEIQVWQWAGHSILVGSAAVIGWIGLWMIRLSQRSAKNDGVAH